MRGCDVIDETCRCCTKLRGLYSEDWSIITAKFRICLPLYNQETDESVENAATNKNTDSDSEDKERPDFVEVQDTSLLHQKNSSSPDTCEDGRGRLEANYIFMD
ncbi:hypothetical protein P8452_69452 [Trifolium repens]|nr:hypothetical protein P8452_69452 [Trifolium repens]